MRKGLSVEERKDKCFNYFQTNCIKNREQLREFVKKLPISGVTNRFAEEVLPDYLEIQRAVERERDEVSYKRGEGRKKAIVINDLHIPYHDEKAVDLVFDCIVDTQPDYLILNGDILDFYGCSKFQKKPDKLLMLQDEIDIFYKLFKDLRPYIPNTEVRYVLGNHEERLTKVMAESGGLFKLKALESSAVLKLDKLNISCYNLTFTLNGLIFKHGDVVRKDSGSSAKAELLAHNNQSGISGHTHRLGMYYHTYAGCPKFWYENGCLCSLNPDYLKDPNKADWQQGFAIIDMYDGLNQVNQILIQDYKFIYNEKLYK